MKKLFLAFLLVPGVTFSAHVARYVKWGFGVAGIAAASRVRDYETASHILEKKCIQNNLDYSKNYSKKSSQKTLGRRFELDHQDMVHFNPVFKKIAAQQGFIADNSGGKNIWFLAQNGKDKFIDTWASCEGRSGKYRAVYADRVSLALLKDFENKSINEPALKPKYLEAHRRFEAILGHECVHLKNNDIKNKFYGELAEPFVLFPWVAYCFAKKQSLKIALTKVAIVSVGVHVLKHLFSCYQEERADKQSSKDPEVLRALARAFKEEPLKQRAAALLPLPLSQQVSCMMYPAMLSTPVLQEKSWAQTMWDKARYVFFRCTRTHPHDEERAAYLMEHADTLEKTALLK